MTFGSVIRILVVGCLVGPALTMEGPTTTTLTMEGPTTTTKNCGGFSVRKAVNSGPTTKPGIPLHFQENGVLTNLGGWDKSTSIFTAPCAGAYFFSFSAISPKQNHDFQLALMKGGIYQVTAYGAKNGWETGSNSALLVLELGEKVHLQLQEGEVHDHTGDEAFTTFTGFLVQETM